MPSVNGAFCLYLCFIIYLLVGGGIFYLSEQYYNDGHNITRLNAVNSSLPSVLAVTDVWDFFAGTFFAMTILTTVGYGNFVPHTVFGKAFTIVYGTIGIPVAGIILARFSDKFGEKLLKFYEKERQRITSETLAIIIAACVFVFSGFSVFMFLPAAIFSSIEGWEYLDSFYFAFVTLTTIGFGDIVAAQHGDVSWLWLYRISTLIWQFVGIGYWLVVAQFITKALQVIMDFLFHFGATMSDVETNHQQTYITGINALMNNKRTGVAALFNLPVAMVTRNSQNEGFDIQKDPEAVSKEDKGGKPNRKTSILSLSSFKFSRTPSTVSVISANDKSPSEDVRKTSVFGSRKRSTSHVSRDLLQIDPIKCLAVLHYLLESIYELDDNRVNDIIADCMDVVSNEHGATSEDDGIEIKFDGVEQDRSDCEDPSEQRTIDSVSTYESRCKIGACLVGENCKFCEGVTKGRFETSSGSMTWEEVSGRYLEIKGKVSQESSGVQDEKTGESLKVLKEKLIESKAEKKRRSVKFQQEKNNDMQNETTKSFSRFVQVKVDDELFDRVSRTGKNRETKVDTEEEEVTDISTDSRLEFEKRPMERRRRFGVTSVASVDSGCDFSEENEMSVEREKTFRARSDEA